VTTPLLEEGRPARPPKDRPLPDTPSDVSGTVESLDTVFEQSLDVRAADTPGTEPDLRPLGTEAEEDSHISNSSASGDGLAGLFDPGTWLVGSKWFGRTP